MLDTEAAGTSTWAGQIDRIETSPVLSRTQVGDVEPSEFSNISDWKGFASDDHYFYYLNTFGSTSGAPSTRGRIDRTDLDGTNRVIGIADIDPSPYAAVEAWRGFATDGEFFYLLNTNGGGGVLGRVERINLDGTGPRVTLFDIDPSLFNDIENWKGLATDGNYFFVLNTIESGGEIDRISFDGTTRETIVDLDPVLFGSIQHWQGFAAVTPQTPETPETPVVPEPSTLVLAVSGLFGIGRLGWQRRKRTG